MKNICISYSQSVKLLLIAFVITLLSSCGGGSSSKSSDVQVFETVTGVAQKGPFAIGSEISISRLDDQGIPTGEQLSTSIKNSKGDFEVELPKEWDRVFYKVNGKAFDEASGSFSDSNITLTAYSQSVNANSVNLLTHWAAQRTDKLVIEGNSFVESVTQANAELEAVFGIDQIHTLDFTKSNIDENDAMLLLLSGSLMEISESYQVNPQQIIDDIKNDFANDGKLSELGDDWFLRMQAKVKLNPQTYVSNYSRKLRDKLSLNVSINNKLPELIPLASRPVASVPAELIAEPGETIILDGSASHDSGNIINFTWFRVDQQTQYPVPVSDRFAASPSITTPSEAEVLAAPNQEIALLYALVVTDEEKLTHTGVVKVIVKIPPPENNPPVADSQILVTDEDLPIGITLTASDQDGNSINYVLSTPLSTPNGLVELSSSLPNVLYTPTPDYFGQDSFTFLVNDGFANSNIATVDIQINPVNDAPIADPQSVSTQEGEPVDITLTGTDVDNDSLSFSYDSVMPQHGALSGTPPNITYTPNSTFSGDDQFDFIVNDGELNSLPALVTVSVEALNNIPVATSFSININQEETVLITQMGGTDADSGDTLTIVDITNPANGSIDQSTSGGSTTYEYTPDSGFYGIDAYTYKVSDGKDNSLPAVVTINVNGRPTANAGTPQTVDVGDNVLLNGSGSDPEDGTNVSYNWTAPAGVVLDNPSAEDPSFTAPSGVSTLTFSLVVADQDTFESESSSVEVTVNPSVNNNPTAESFTVVIIPDRTNYFELRGADIDAGETESLRYEIIQQASIDEVDLSGTSSDSKFAEIGAYNWPDVVGTTDSFTYRVKDIHDAVSSEATVTLIVPDPKVPVADAGRDRTISGGRTRTLYGDGYDIDGTIESYTWRQLDGDPVSIDVTSTNGRVIKFEAPTVAKDEIKEIQLGLIVEDDDGYESLEDTVTFTVVHACYLIANAGVDRLEHSGTNPVSLYGNWSESGNCGSEGTHYDAVYIWEQVDANGNPLPSGDPNIVSLSGADTYNPMFTAPSVTSGSVSLYFKLQVNDIYADPSDPIDPSYESDIVKIDVVPSGTTIPNQKPIAKTNNLQIEVSRFAYTRQISFYGEDPDGDVKALTYRIVEKPPTDVIGSLSEIESYTPGTGYVTYTPKYPVPEDSYSFKFVAVDNYGAESDPVEVILKPAPIPSGNTAPTINPKDFTIKNSEIAWNSSRTFEAFYLDDNGISVSDPEDDYYEFRVVDETLNGLTFNFSRSSTYGWSIFIQNSSGSATSSGTIRYIAVDRHGFESEEATFTVTGD